MTLFKYNFKFLDFGKQYFFLETPPQNSFSGKFVWSSCRNHVQYQGPYFETAIFLASILCPSKRLPSSIVPGPGLVPDYRVLRLKCKKRQFIKSKESYVISWSKLSTSTTYGKDFHWYLWVPGIPGCPNCTGPRFDCRAQLPKILLFEFSSWYLLVEGWASNDPFTSILISKTLNVRLKGRQKGAPFPSKSQSQDENRFFSCCQHPDFFTQVKSPIKYYSTHRCDQRNVG